MYLIWQVYLVETGTTTGNLCKIRRSEKSENMKENFIWKMFDVKFSLFVSSRVLHWSWTLNKFNKTLFFQHTFLWNKTQMNRLPTELWRSIFRLLDYRDIHNRYYQIKFLNLRISLSLLDVDKKCSYLRAELVSKAWYFMCWNELESVKLDPYLYENGQELLTNLLYKPVEKLKVFLQSRSLLIIRNVR